MRSSKSLHHDRAYHERHRDEILARRRARRAAKKEERAMPRLRTEEQKQRRNELARAQRGNMWSHTSMLASDDVGVNDTKERSRIERETAKGSQKLLELLQAKHGVAS